MLAVAEKFDQPGRARHSENGSGVFLSNFLLKNDLEAFTPDPDDWGGVVKEQGRGPAKHYTYRADGRLAGFQEGNLEVRYLYDALDRRVAKVVKKKHPLLRHTEKFTQSFVHLEEEDLPRGENREARQDLSLFLL